MSRRNGYHKIRCTFNQIYPDKCDGKCCRCWCHEPVRKEAASILEEALKQ